MFFGWGFFLISSGGQALHVLRARMWALHTCGRAKRNRIDHSRSRVFLCLPVSFRYRAEVVPNLGSTHVRHDTS